MITEVERQRLIHLLSEERRNPGSRPDQISTWLENAANDDGPAVVELLRSIVRSNPGHITALYRASEQDAEFEDLVWIQQLNHGIQAPAGWDALDEFIDVAKELCIEHLAQSGLGEDDVVITARVQLYENKPDSAFGLVSVDFQSLDRPNAAASYAAREFTTENLPDLLLRSLCDVLVDEVTCAVKPKVEMKVGPLFGYHPERMRASRAYLKKQPALEVREGKPMVLNAQIQSLVNAIQTEMATRHMEFSIVERDATGEAPAAPVYSEINLASTYLCYVGSGREIFDFPVKLSDMLALSDADDLRLEQIRTPYQALYIHFGRRQDMQLAPGWQCDGAYILNDAQCMTVRITARPDDDSDVRDWPIRSEPVFTFHFLPQDQPLDLGTAVDVAIARDMKELSDEAASAPLRQIEAEDAAMDAGLDPGSIRISTAERATKQQAEILSRKEVAHRALSLVVNALCYLTAYPDDIERVWPASAPAALREQTETGATPGARKRAEQQLISEGYSRIRLCGAQFRRDDAADVATGVSVRAHWRRGHFRNQQHGPGRQLRKLVWIMPVLVNSAAMAEDSQLPGHIYKPEIPD